MKGGDDLFDSIGPGTVALMGVPWDEHSSFMRGPALAPPKIRGALHSGSCNLCAEKGEDLGTGERFRDVGDLSFEGQGAPVEVIEKAAGRLLTRGARILCLGGDHAVTYPLLRAYAAKFGPVDVLHLDAHPDLYDEFEGDPLSHACPFARVMEEGLAARLIQVGIRTMNPHQRSQADRFGVEVMEMKDWNPSLLPAFERPVYLSLDLDVLDPAFAPGVSHHEPGGLSTREVIRVIQGLKGSIIGADIVEYNPTRDPIGMTAMVAAKMVKEIAAKMLMQEES
ncbi:MAG: agmatinase [Deltaproteobacteria bacterium]|nr:agmatinase [Deltaproteobacteria bacterium]MBW2016568.1 agmatinase [Deltaproteobacteria bacterium]MBW2129333.1 agmatinase [Deltaproteobacteria bacterium]MBW2303294.1 agmatinase [Deltaproteobacteria bacterium]